MVDLPIFSRRIASSIIQLKHEPQSPRARITISEFAAISSCLIVAGDPAGFLTLTNFLLPKFFSNSSNITLAPGLVLSKSETLSKSYGIGFNSSLTIIISANGFRTSFSTTLTFISDTFYFDRKILK